MCVFCICQCHRSRSIIRSMEAWKWTEPIFLCQKELSCNLFCVNLNERRNMWMWIVTKMTSFLAFFLLSLGCWCFVWWRFWQHNQKSHINIYICDYDVVFCCCWWMWILFRYDITHCLTVYHCSFYYVRSFRLATSIYFSLVWSSIVYVVDVVVVSYKTRYECATYKRYAATIELLA